MKQFAAACLLLLTVISACILSGETIVRTSEQLHTLASEMLENETKGDKALAAEQADALLLFWEQRRDILEILVPLEQLDSLEQSLTRSVSFLRSGDGQFRTEAEVLCSQLLRISHRYKITWENFL